METEEKVIQKQPCWIPSIEKNLETLFSDFFMNNLQGHIRNTTLTLLVALWSKANDIQKDNFLKVIKNYASQLLNYGKTSDILFNLFTQILKFESKKQNFEKYRGEIKEILQHLISSATTASLNLINHKNHSLYLFLENIVDDESQQFKPQYFELNGCLKCYGSFFGKFKNERIQFNQDIRGERASGQEIRGNQNKLIIRLQKQMEINQVMLRLSEFTTKRRYTQYFKQINIYVNNSVCNDLQQLKNDMQLWKKIKSTSLEKLPENSREIPIKFTLPITTKFILIEVNQVQKTTFPNCQRCQAVNNEGVGIFCNSCAFSPFFEVDQTLISCRLALDSDSIQIDNDKSKEICEKNIVDFISKINSCWQQLLNEKQKLKILMDRYKGIKCQNSLQIQLDNQNLELTYEELMTNLNALLANKKVLSQYMGQLKEIDIFFDKEKVSNCYGCMQSYLKNFLLFFNTKEVIDQLVEIQTPLEYQGIQIKIQNIIEQTTNNKLSTQLYKTQVLLIINNLTPDILSNVIQQINDLNKQLQNIQTQNLFPIHNQLIFMSEFILNLNKILQNEKKNNSEDTKLQNLKNQILLILFENLNQILILSFNDSNFTNLIVVPILEIIKKEICNQVSYDLYHIYQEEKQNNCTAATTSNQQQNQQQNLSILQHEKNFQALFMKEEIKRMKERVLMSTDKLQYLKEKDRFKELQYKEFALNIVSNFNKEDKKTVLQPKPQQINQSKNEQINQESKIIIDKILSDQYNQILVNVLQNFSLPRLYEILNEIFSVIARIKKKKICQIFNKALPFILHLETEGAPFFDLYKKIVSIIVNEEKIFEKKQENHIDILEDLFKVLEKKLQLIENPCLLKNQDFIMIQLDQGYSLKELVQIIKNYIDDKEVKKQFKENNQIFMKYILNSVIKIRKFKLILNQNFSVIDSTMSQLFEQLQSDKFEEKQTFLRELIIALPSHQKDYLGQEFLLEQCSKILLPNKRHEVFLKVEVLPGHRDYIPQQMPPNKYPASEFGKTMGDVMNRIKAEMDQQIDLEMLVAKKLINNKDLSINLVYSKVWLPSQNPTTDILSQISKPMQVTYRITGLDGEATEETIDNLVDDDEILALQLSKALAENVESRDGKMTCGIEVLLDILIQIYKDKLRKSKVENVVRILSIASNHEQAKFQVLQFNGLKILIKLLIVYLSDYKEGESDIFIESVLDLINILLTVVDYNIQQTMFRKDSDRMQIEENQQDEENICIQHIEQIIQKIQKLQEKAGIYFFVQFKESKSKGSAPKMVTEFSRLLPLVTNNLMGPSIYLVNYFGKDIQFDIKLQSKEQQLKTQRFIEMLEVLSEYYISFQTACLQCGLVEKLLKSFEQIFPNIQEINTNIIIQHKDQLQICLPVILGLIKGNIFIQQKIHEKNIFNILYKLSDPSIKVENIGKVSQDIINYMANEKSLTDPQIHAYIKNIKNQFEDEKKKKFLKKKIELEMKMKQMQSQIQNKNLLDFEKEHIKCISCKEGYASKPEELLGCYIFSNETNIPDVENWIVQKEIDFQYEKPGVNSVTSFQCIHLKCHQEAVKFDKQQKNPKKEWEGAEISRNMERKCNNWFPIRGSQITQKQVNDGINKYFQSIQEDRQLSKYFPGLVTQNIGKQTYIQIWIILNDFKSQLVRFSTQQDPSKDSRTTYEQNIKMLPFYVQIISNFLSQSNYKQFLQNALEILDKFILRNEDQSDILKVEQYYLQCAFSIFLMTNDQWSKKYKQKLFIKILQTSAKKISVEDSNYFQKVFQKVQPLMIMICLVNFFFDRLHAKLFQDVEQIDLSALNEKIDQQISSYYEKYLEVFQDLYTLFKNDLINIKRIKDFITYLKIDEVMQNEDVDIYRQFQQEI